MRTLIIEDSKPTLELLKDVLANLKQYSFIGSAAGEEEAVALIVERDPDLVLLDLGLTSGSGLAVLRRIRQQGCGARVLVITNSPDEAYRQACMASGADGFYDKSLELPALYERLAAWIPPIPANEEMRLRALRRLEVLDTPAEAVFDEVTRLCADLLDVPISLVSLVDGERQWLKSRVGLDALETARTVSFCAHAILSPATFVVEDASQDLRFADNPLVRGPLHIRFYAGVPLILAAGEAVGTLCVIDQEPRKLLPRQQRLLEVLARKVVAELELRQRLLDLEAEIRHCREMEVRVMHLATRDPLTGLPNRAALMDRLQQGIKLAERENHALAFLFLDLDRFKRINDTLGHAVGDGLLQHLGERLTRALRESDTVARMGGDELAVVLHHIESCEQAQQVAEKLLDTLRRPLRVGGYELHPACSLGLAVYPLHGESEELLIRHADLALYDAKRGGGHRWRCYDPAMNAAVVQRMTLESELRQALQRQQLELHYQPQVALEDGRLTGLEALLRWTHPEQGAIPPNRFIPLAEETGLIWDLGRFVIEAACRQLADWRARGLRPPRLAVNVSPAQLRPGLAVVLRESLGRHGCAGEDLEVEITESALTADGLQVRELLDELHRMGVHIAVDDFGVGYSSLSLLRRLPLDTLKVDKAFIDEIATNPRDASIVGAILHMSHALGLHTVAEGVEDGAQRDVLHAMGCGSMQGFLLSRALPAGEVEGWLPRDQRAIAPEGDGKARE